MRNRYHGRHDNSPRAVEGRAAVRVRCANWLVHPREILTRLPQTPEGFSADKVY
jgi:hypothetical protein